MQMACCAKKRSIDSDIDEYFLKRYCGSSNINSDGKDRCSIGFSTHKIRRKDRCRCSIGVISKRKSGTDGKDRKCRCKFRQLAAVQRFDELKVQQVANRISALFLSPSLSSLFSHSHCVCAFLTPLCEKLLLKTLY